MEARMRVIEASFDRIVQNAARPTPWKAWVALLWLVAALASSVHTASLLRAEEHGNPALYRFLFSSIMPKPFFAWLSRLLKFSSRAGQVDVFSALALHCASLLEPSAAVRLWANAALTALHITAACALGVALPTWNVVAVLLAAGVLWIALFAQVLLAALWSEFVWMTLFLVRAWLTTGVSAAAVYFMFDLTAPPDEVGLPLGEDGRVGGLRGTLLRALEFFGGDPIFGRRVLMAVRLRRKKRQ